MHNLNDAQREAVLHREGPMLVTAGPGSGKTHVITTRLIHMIHDLHIPPENIAVITFTKEAATSMENRFRSVCESSVFFGTFHSFYYQIIKSISKYSKYRLIYEKEKKHILWDLLRQKNGEEDFTEETIEKVLQGISFFKNTLRLQQSAEKAGLNQEKFLSILNVFDEEKERKSCMDFDDMLYICLGLLEKDSLLLGKWQDRFRYFMVDEFQDCNPIQYKILQLLAKGSGNNLFVVGDDDQAVYGFRGAESMILQHFLKDYPEAKHVTLGINYRCSEKIVKASALVIEENTMRIRKQLKAVQHLEDDSVSIKKWTDRREMYQYMTDMLERLSEEETKQHVVLFRTNYETQTFAVELVRRHIPFRIKDRSMSIYEHFLVRDILAFLLAGEGRRERSIYLRILNKPRSNIGREALEEEVVDFEKMKRFYQSPYMYRPEAVRDIEGLEHHILHLHKLPMFLKVRYIRMAMNYEKYLMRRAEGNTALFDSWRELLDWVEEDVSKFATVSEWEKYQKEYEEQMKHVRTNESSGIFLMTLHGAKGLEYEHCHILDVNEGVIPKYQKGQKLTKEQLEEERRIFYVGMTRAKKTLELHYLTGKKERPKFPSRFLKKLL